MEEKETVIEGPLFIGGTKVLVVGNLRLGSIGLMDGDAYFGTKKPTHVIVISGSERRAFTIEGEEIAPEKLIKDIPGLSSYL